INDLLKGDVSETRRLRYIAKQIAGRAAVKPVMVYRLKRTGEFRCQSAHSPSAVRVSPEQIIGTYDEGADSRAILEDLRCAAERGRGARLRVGVILWATQH